MKNDHTQRRHDLDALRALTMLLGIVLHALLSFVPQLWPIQDRSLSPALALPVMAIHGFRMPLFFLLSGYFTALLWRQRGLKALLEHRAKRILVPCLLALLTIVPTYRALVRRALQTAPTVVATKPESLAEAARRGDREQTVHLLKKGAELNTPDPSIGATPLAWAALRNDLALMRLLIAHGANVHQVSRGNATPLHCAALLGNESTLRELLRHGATPDTLMRSERGDTPGELTYTDTATTQRLIGILGLPPRAQAEIEEGRKRCRALLPPATPRSQPLLESARAHYAGLLLAPALATPVFEHLWFLWFLCWLLPGIILWTKLLPSAHYLVVALGLIPLTLVSQLFMGILTPSFGPDTATGLVPPPHLLIHYGAFFLFGASLFLHPVEERRLTRYGALLTTLGLSVCFPVALMTQANAPYLSGVFQVGYAWFMIFGLLGQAHKYLAKRSTCWRYLSDASYWFYLAHLPVVVALQLALRELALPIALKLTLVLVTTSAILLLSYHYLVRGTLLGALLNGKRQRAQPMGAAIRSKGHEEAME